MRIVFPYDGYENLGIGYLASIADRNGYEVKLYPLSFGDYIRGYSQQTITKIEKERNAILQLKPDLVAFSLNSFMAGSMIGLAHLLRKAGIKTIAGGPHCSAEPCLTAETNAFDGVIAGEADYVFINSIENIFRDNYNLPWLFTPEKKIADYVAADDLDKIPFPAKSLFYNINKFESQDYKIITSRGCPYRCIFCFHSNPRIISKYRKRSIDNIIDELTSAKKSFGIKSVYFLDDVFAIDEVWIRDFIKIYRQKINLPFHAICHPNNINSEIASSLKNGGCFAVRMGVQTTSQRIKNRIGRPETNKKIVSAINCFKERGIKVEVDHIVNLPDETLDEARDSVAFYNNLRPKSIKVYWLMPLPGTIWFNQVSVQKLITEEQRDNLRKGKGFGKHSYLFYNKYFHNRDWLGIHFLLSYLPLLPAATVKFLIRIKADRILRIPSFFLLAGVPRALNLSGKWDNVGREHIKRIFGAICKQFIRNKKT